MLREVGLTRKALVKYRKQVPHQQSLNVLNLRPVGEAALREFGRRLASARKLKGFKQLTLASLLGLSRTSISNIERGEQRISLELAYQAAYVLGVSLQTLLPTLEDVAPSLSTPQTGRVHTASDELPLVAAAEEETLRMIQQLQSGQARRLSAAKTRKRRKV
jgi:transcriptional regulator with XRE-family HTH domain